MTTTTNKGLNLPAYGSVSPSWDIPVNANFSIIDAALGGTTSLSTTTGTVVLTAAQYQSAFFLISGTLTGNVTYTIPSGVNGDWVYDTTGLVQGGFTLTINYGGGGASIVLLANNQGSFFCTALGVKTLASTLSTTTGSGSVVLATGATMTSPSITTPTFTGLTLLNPTIFNGYTLVNGVMSVPTQAAADSTANVASTAFVQTAINAKIGFTLPKVYSYFTAGSYTYTPTSGAKWIRARFVGGGGSGACSNSAAYYGGSGGAGGYGEVVLAAATYTFTVGAGGAGSTTTTGNSGGTTYFGQNLGTPYWATPGSGGSTTTGGAGGSGTSNCSVYAVGGPGASGAGAGASGGGASYFGGGGQLNATGTGGTASAWGAGGSGSYLAYASGAGAVGIVVIEEYFA